MVVLRLALGCTLGVLLLLPPAATAGGWWSSMDVNPSHVAPGERVEIVESVMFSSDTAAHEAQETGRFYVYLLRGFDYSIVERAMRKPQPRGWWSLGDAEAIAVGQATVSVTDSNLARATAAFTMPDVPPATYDVMLCDAGCTKPLADDVIPVRGFTVVADPATAKLARRADRLDRRTSKQARRLAAARAEADKALAAARNARAQVEKLETTVASQSDRSASSTPVDAGWLAAGTLIGALALLTLRRPRRHGR